MHAPSKGRSEHFNVGEFDGSMKCTTCGNEFHCGMHDAKPCWCAAEYPRVLPVPAALKACLCPRCLALRIEARSADANQST